MGTRLPQDETPRSSGRTRDARKGGGQSRKKGGGGGFEGGEDGLEGHEGSHPLSSASVIDHPPKDRLPRNLSGVPALVLPRCEPGESLESWMSRSEGAVAEWSMGVVQDENQPDALRVLAYSKMMDLMIAGRKGKLAAAGKAVARVVGDREQALMGAARSVQGMSDAELARVVEGGYSNG